MAAARAAMGAAGRRRTRGQGGGVGEATEGGRWWRGRRRGGGALGGNGWKVPTQDATSVLDGTSAVVTHTIVSVVSTRDGTAATDQRSRVRRPHSLCGRARARTRLWARLEALAAVAEVADDSLVDKVLSLWHAQILKPAPLMTMAGGRRTRSRGRRSTRLVAEAEVASCEADAGQAAGTGALARARSRCT